MRYPNFNASYILAAVVVCYTTLTFLIGLPFQFFLFTTSLTCGGKVDWLPNQRMVYWKGQHGPVYLQSFHKTRTHNRPSSWLPHLGWQSCGVEKVNWHEFSLNPRHHENERKQKKLSNSISEKYHLCQLVVLSRKHFISTRWHYPDKQDLQLLLFWIYLELNSKNV